ncbi:MAG: hypothetical protein WCJ35_06920 [Planctomycetota bacterium]
MSDTHFPPNKIPVKQFRRIYANLSTRMEIYGSIAIMSINQPPLPCNFSALLAASSHGYQHNQQEQQALHGITSNRSFATVSRNTRDKE